MKRATENNGYVPDELNISIHALVKRATIIFKYFVLYNIISIHALVKRATLIARQVKMRSLFQSTPS